MPVEIKELVIKAVATMTPEDDKNDENDEKLSQKKPVDDKEAIIQACVEQVLKVLKRKKER